MSDLDAKLKHLDYIQAAIARMANNSFLFKGWAVTLAAGLGALAAVESRTTLLAIGIITTAMFWGLDGYYLWLERGFVALHNKVAATPSDRIDFAMAVDKTSAFKRWFCTLFRYHLIGFYGVVIAFNVLAIVFMKKGK